MAFSNWGKAFSEHVRGKVDLDRAGELSDLDQRNRYNTVLRYSAQTSQDLASLVNFNPSAEGNKVSGENGELPAVKEEVLSPGSAGGQLRMKAGHGISSAFAFENHQLDSKIRKFNTVMEPPKQEEQVSSEQLNAQVEQDLQHISHKLKAIKAGLKADIVTVLESGEEMEDGIEENETRIYKLTYKKGFTGFKVVLRAVEGDPDLYVCQHNHRPDKANHTWRSASEGIDVVHVHPGNPAFRSTHVYIGIHGHSKSYYYLKATWIQAKQEKGTYSRARKSAAARIAEKIETFRATHPHSNANIEHKTARSAKKNILRELSRIRLGQASTHAKRAKSIPQHHELNRFEPFFVSTRTSERQDIDAGLRALAPDSRIPRNRRQDSSPRKKFLVTSCGSGTGEKLLLEKERQLIQQRTERHLEGLINSFKHGERVRELGGLTLEQPLASKHHPTRQAFQRRLVVQGPVCLQRMSSGMSNDEMNQERQVVSAKRRIGVFRG